MNQFLMILERLLVILHAEIHWVVNKVVLMVCIICLTWVLNTRLKTQSNLKIAFLKKGEKP